MADVKAPRIEEMIGLGIQETNWRASLQHLEDATRADLQVRDRAIWKMMSDLEALRDRVAQLESERGVKVEQAQAQGHLQAESEPAGPGGATDGRAG